MGAMLLGLALFSVFQTPFAAQVEAVDRIVAVVDDDVVVKSELEREFATIVSQLRQQTTKLPPRNVLERQVLERLILKKLQLAAAERAGITIGEDLLAQTVGNIARNNDLTLREFRQVLEQGGISFASYREGVRNEMIIRRLREQEIRRRIRITDQEVAAFIARLGSTLSERSAYRLFHILISTPEGASAEQLGSARNKAAGLVQQLRSGNDFRTLALTESDGRQALEGGDLGWRPANQLPTLFVDRVQTMEKGEISDPIRTPSGYHIIKLEDYKGGDRHIIEQSHVRHILINTNEITSDQNARIRLEQLKQRIDGGDDFAALARSHSDDKSSAIKGGDLGWTSPGDLLPRFEEEINKLPPKQVSEPFRTEFGWHLAEVLDRRQHDSTREVQKAEARKAIQKRKMSEETELYLRRLRDEAYVDIRLEDL
ncbi:peptidylprolyl isomerase [Solemya velesiana gill symbiont]|uniref:Chaperone SurA n=1 Tax=Solemya velesiana gill symbiont TaxID=1918948 RepID=A0A1T2KY88_9GAMM|nr:molecular chaperone SurA [Solemya velesiana gill symbiont]